MRQHSCEVVPDSDVQSNDDSECSHDRNNYASPPNKKKKRDRSESAKRVHALIKHPLKVVTCACTKNCSSVISDIQRLEIHKQYWAMSYNDRRQFIFSHTERKVKASTTVGHESRRASSFTYRLRKESGELVQVCKVFFLTSLGYYPKNDAAITAVMKATPLTSIAATTDLRGKHPPVNKFDNALIVQHIDSFHPQISHYRRAHAPLRRYLPSDITIVAMHSDFKTKYPTACGYQTYRKVVHEQKISFTKLGEEQCETCEEYKNMKHCHDSLAADISDNQQSNCTECSNWHTHIKKATDARKLYRDDAEKKWPDDVSVRSVDLQKVIMLPRMPGIKSVAFTKRIIAFHETFATLGTSKKLKSKLRNISVLWHEGVAGRKAEEIASAFVKAINHERDKRHIIYWLDNCAGQNKNWCLFTTMTTLVNSAEIQADDITFKYFESGHTFMSADSFHHGVEQEMRKQAGGNVYDFDDFCSIVKQSNGGLVDVLVQSNEDFANFTGEQSQTKLKKLSRPRLSDIVEVQFQRGSRQLQYKTEYSQTTYSYFNFLKKTFRLAMPTTLLRASARGIQTSKKTDIVNKLCPLMPSNRRHFWNSIPASDGISDLVDNFE